MPQIALEGQALLVQHLEALLVRANSGEFSKIPEKRGENTTLALRDELIKINSNAVMGKYNS